MISPAIVSATDGGTLRYDLSVNNLQEDIEIEDDSISGKLKYVTSYSGFGDKEASSPSHYLALDVVVPEGTTVTTKIEGGANDDYVDLTNDEFCVYRIKDTSQLIKVKTEKAGQATEKTYNLNDLILEGPVGESAFVKDKTDYGNFGKTTDYYDAPLNLAWDGTDCIVTGTLKWVPKSTATKLSADGNYFAFKLDDYYSGKNITVINGSSEKSAVDTDWVCKVSKEKQSITVRDGVTVIATFDLSGLTLNES